MSKTALGQSFRSIVRSCARGLPPLALLLAATAAVAAAPPGGHDAWAGSSAERFVRGALAFATVNAVWLFLAVALLVLRRRVNRMPRFVAAAVMVGTLVALLLAAFNHRQLPAADGPAFLGAEWGMRVQVFLGLGVWVWLFLLLDSKPDGRRAGHASQHAMHAPDGGGI